MHRLPMILSLLSIFSSATPGAPVTSAVAAGILQNDPSIVEGSDAYLKAVLACDVPAIAAMFDEDARLMPPNQSLLHGKKDIEGFYASLCHGPAKVTAFTFNHIEARVAGDAAYDVGTYKMVLAAGPGQTVEDNGKYSVILRRDADGLKIAYLIFNTDLPQQPPRVDAK